MDRYACGDDAAFSELYDLLAPQALVVCHAPDARRRGDPGPRAADVPPDALRAATLRARGRRRAVGIRDRAAAPHRHFPQEGSGPRLGGGRRRRRRARASRPAHRPRRSSARRRLARRMSEELARVSEADRTAFELVRFDGLSMAEAAEVLGTTANAVKLRAFRAAEVLRARARRRGARGARGIVVTEDLKARILESARATRSPPRRASQLHAWLVLPSSVIVAAALFFAFDGLHHGQGRPSWFYVASSLGWAAVAALSLWAAIRQGRVGARALEALADGGRRRHPRAALRDDVRLRRRASGGDAPAPRAPRPQVPRAHGRRGGVSRCSRSPSSAAAAIPCIRWPRGPRSERPAAPPPA